MEFTGSSEVLQLFWNIMKGYSEVHWMSKRDCWAVSLCEMHSAHVLGLFYFLSHLGKCTGSFTFVCWAAVLDLHLRNCLPSCEFSDIMQWYISNWNRKLGQSISKGLSILNSFFFFFFEIPYYTISAILILCIVCKFSICMEMITILHLAKMYCIYCIPHWNALEFTFHSQVNK